MTRSLGVPCTDGGSLPALLDAPAQPAAVYVFAHGAGAGMRHAFMAAVAQGLAERGVACLRFDFPFMAQGSRRPDPPPWRRRPCALPSPKPRACFRACRCSPAASPSAVA